MLFQVVRLWLHLKEIFFVMLRSNCNWDYDKKRKETTTKKNVEMACQKVCKQDRDDAWNQMSTYWQSSIPTSFSKLDLPVLIAWSMWSKWWLHTQALLYKCLGTIVSFPTIAPPSPPIFTNTEILRATKQQLRGYVFISVSSFVSSFQFSFPVSISFSFPAFPYAWF